VKKCDANLTIKMRRCSGGVFSILTLIPLLTRCSKFMKFSLLDQIFHQLKLSLQQGVPCLKLEFPGRRDPTIPGITAQASNYSFINIPVVGGT
jgi:hypothetical protein